MQVLKPGSRKFDTNHNWKVYHPNGKHMFTTSSKRANWYLTKAGAIEIGEHQIQLTKVPKGEGFADDEIFGLLPRINRCVVCAAIDELQRHHVVPYHYRKFMPIDYKSRNHHDVVLICRQHHEEYEVIAKDYKTFIARKYNVGTIEELNNAYISEVVERLRRKFKMSKLLSTIIDNFNEIPTSKIEVIAQELSTMVRFNVLEKDFAYLELIRKKIDRHIAKEKSEVLHINDYYHGNLVVKQFKSHDDFEVFIKGWRSHFVQTMKPQFMPEGWSVDFRCKK
jgi:hypothetical protein